MFPFGFDGNLQFRKCCAIRYAMHVYPYACWTKIFCAHGTCLYSNKTILQQRWFLCPYICTCWYCRNVDFEYAHMELFGLPPSRKCCDVRHAKQCHSHAHAKAKTLLVTLTHVFMSAPLNLQQCGFLVSTISISWPFGLWILNVPTWVYGKLQIRKCCAIRYAMQFLNRMHAERTMLVPITQVFLSAKLSWNCWTSMIVPIQEWHHHPNPGLGWMIPH